MTLVARPVPPTVGRPELAVPKTTPSSCGCDDPDLVRLHDLMATGMSQWDASRLIWSPDLEPALSARPGVWATWFVHHELTARIPWLRPVRNEKGPHAS